MGKKKKADAVQADAIATTEETPIEAQPEAVADPAPTKDEKPKKRRKHKPVAIGGDASLSDLAGAYLLDMEEQGKSEGTISSYRMELRVAMDELGESTAIATITPDQVQEFFESKRVTKLRSGRNKAKPSVDKTRRVLRLALCWAAERGIIEKAPLPEPEPAK